MTRYGIMGDVGLTATLFGFELDIAEHWEIPDAEWPLYLKRARPLSPRGMLAAGPADPTVPSFVTEEYVHTGLGIYRRTA